MTNRKFFLFAQLIAATLATVNLKYHQSHILYLMSDDKLELRHSATLIDRNWWMKNKNGQFIVKFLLESCPNNALLSFVQQCIIRNDVREKRKKRYSYPHNYSFIAYFSIDHVSTFYTFRFNVTDSQRRTEKRKKKTFHYLFIFVCLYASYALPLATCIDPAI